MTVERPSISKKRRFELFKRDGFTCQYCGATPPAVVLHLDHILALANGGSGDDDNLITACEPCNSGKGARSLTAVPQSLADKASDVEEREAQLLGFQAILDAKRHRLDDETWRVLHVMFPFSDSVPRDQYNSTRRFVEKLGLHATLEAADAAMASSARFHMLFRYFCGVCWNKLRETNR